MKSVQRIAQKYHEPKFCDALFYVGETEIAICVIGSALGMQSEYFEKLLYNSNFDQKKKECKRCRQLLRSHYKSILRARCDSTCFQIYCAILTSIA